MNKDQHIIVSKEGVVWWQGLVRPKSKLLAISNDFIAIHIPGSTQYVSRMTGSQYCSASIEIWEIQTSVYSQNDGKTFYHLSNLKLSWDTGKKKDIK